METSSGQEMLEEAKKRKPDELEIRINIQAPRLYFPVRGKARGDGFGKTVGLRAIHYVGKGLAVMLILKGTHVASCIAAEPLLKTENSLCFCW